MGNYEKPYGGLNLDRHAPGCDDQLATISRVGRGPKGNGFRVEVKDPDTTNETYLEGWEYDETTKRSSKVWESDNINGGELFYHYNLRPYTIPQCFTMTWIYRRPNRPEWSKTTPAIPYIWDSNGDGEPDVDGLVGSGVGALWFRSRSTPWRDLLIYPPGTTREDFNAPEQGAVWSANIDLEELGILDIDDIAKILGWSKQKIINLLNGNLGEFDGSDNVRDFVMDLRDALQSHIHTDMGFGTSLIGDTPASTIPAINPATWSRPVAGRPYTIKNYIEYMVGRSLDYTDSEIAKVNLRIDDLEGDLGDIIGRITNLESRMTAVENSIVRINRTLTDLLAKIFGGGTINQSTGAITWPNTNKIPVADINIFGVGATPGDDVYANALRSRYSPSTYDLKGN